MAKMKEADFIDELIDSLNRSEVIEAHLISKVVSTLISARVERGMNQKQFADYMGISQAMVSKWENADCNFTIQSIAKICEKLNLVPCLDFFFFYYYMVIKNRDRFVLPETVLSRQNDSNYLVEAA